MKLQVIPHNGDNKLQINATRTEMILLAHELLGMCRESDSSYFAKGLDVGRGGPSPTHFVLDRSDIVCGTVVLDSFNFRRVLDR